MSDQVRLTVFDPRRGAQYDIEFGRKRILRSAEHEWVILADDAKVNCDRSVMASFLASLIARMLEMYNKEELLIQHGPPIYEDQKANRFPKSWRLMIETRDSRVFHVPREQFSDFEGYFRIASSYEQWMFFLIPSNSLASLPAFKPKCIDLDVFLNPSILWNELVWTEGDFGSVTCFLPFTETTDRFVDTLIQEGVAVLAPPQD